MTTPHQQKRQSTPVAVERQVVTVLRADVYAALEASLPKPVVSEKTTDLQAGFNLGVQHVLAILRGNHVIGT